MTQPSIGVAIITHNAKQHLPHCLPPLLNSPLRPQVLVVNSSSNDGTVELAKELGTDTFVIPRNEFNHGTTRERARQHLGTDIIVMMTPDAYPQDLSMLSHLVDPIIKQKASITYARQIPKHGANFFESFSRTFNYPSLGHIRGIENRDQWGIYTCFCSNSCAAYSNSALELIGGFPSVLMGEDTFTVAKLLKLDHKIAYVGEAIVAHSHSYTLLQEFKRSFDTGLARKMHAGLISDFGKDEKRGREYVRQMMLELIRKRPYLIPYATLQTTLKWLGYRLGKASPQAPMWWKRTCSGQDFYWN